MEVEVLVGEKEHSWIERSKIKIRKDQELIEKKRAQKPLTQEKVQVIRNRQLQIEREERLEYQKQTGKYQKEGDISIAESDSDQELVDAESPEEAKQREQKEREEQRRLEEEREAERRRLKELEREIEGEDREEEEEEVVIPIPAPVEPPAMAAPAGFGDSIQIRDLPKFSGEDKENPVQFKQAFYSLLSIYRINLEAPDDVLPDHLTAAVQTLKLCLKGKALAWWIDNYGTAAIDNRYAFDAILKALILQFHPLGKTWKNGKWHGMFSIEENTPP